MPRFASASAIGFALALLAGGCGTFKPQPSGPPCPEVGILRDAANVVKFGPGSSRDITNMMVEAEIVAAKGTCTYESSKGRLTVDFNVAIEATRGPANADRRANVPYFVAVADRAGNVLSKNDFEALFVFPPNRNRVRLNDDEIQLVIPIEENQPGTAFEIFLGFQLTAEELEYNRSTQPRL
ncbi:MAG: hypothetical protein HY521_05415 [Proteobacteria bacterium]|nr:hypothetical protein [Pseudomonadota bacterium]